MVLAVKRLPFLLQVMNKQTVTQIKTVRKKKFSNAFRDNHLVFLVSTGKEEGIQLRGERQ
jgi:hypothetical protein